MHKYAIIVAGGSGQRMGAKLPKQFLMLDNKPVLCYTIEAFTSAYNDIQIVLVLPSEYIGKGEQIITDYNYRSVSITAGGATRFESVKNGLAKVSEPSIIFVHDGVRCLVSKELIQRCYNMALEKGSAIPAIPATDSIRIDYGSSHHVIDRNKIKIIQTPQTFQSGILLPAFNQDYQHTFTDEASVVEAAGKEVFLIEGEHDNLKITRPVDIFLAEQILKSRSGSL